MKKGRIYTIVFMFALSAVFTLLLAGANAFYLPKIEANDLLKDRKAILFVFDIDQSGSADEVLERFDENIKETTLSGIDLYEYTSNDGAPIGYAVKFSGSGLWGTITGYLGVTSNLDEITGLVFTDHSETPGLGGRIDELNYREQFKGIKLTQDTKLTYEGELDAITGATSTSNAVLKILNQLIEDKINELEVLEND